MWFGVLGMQGRKDDNDAFYHECKQGSKQECFNASKQGSIMNASQQGR